MLVVNVWCSWLLDGVGILDPCEKEIVDVTDNLTPQQREDLTIAAQVTSRTRLAAR